jgi:hypothetical protein
MNKELEAALLKGLDTGTEIEMTAEECKPLHDEYEAERLSIYVP